MLTVTVGTKRKSLCSRVSRVEALAVMGEIKSVVQDVIDRLDADFTDNSLYLCFEAFDLSAWDTLLSDTNLGAGQAAGVVADRLDGLRRKARRLCAALGVEWSFEAWVVATRAALSARPCLVQHSGR